MTTSGEDRPETAETIFTILSVNDVYEMIPNERGYGGLAELATIIDSERASSAHSFVTMNGDFLSASAAAEKYQGAHMIDILNHIGIDATVFGNHEFDFGSEVLRTRMAESKFPWLGSNVRERDSGEPFGGALDIFVMDVGSFKIGFFGLCTPDTPNQSFPGDDVVFTDIVSSATAAVDALVKTHQAQVIIGLTHLSLAQDKLVAKKVSGIHLLLGGHDHQPVTLFQGETMIHKSGQNAWYLARIDLHLQLEEEETRTDVVRVHPEWKMILNRGQVPQRACEQVIAQYTDDMSEDEEAKLKMFLALTTTELDTRSSSTRAGASNFCDLVADVLSWGLKADFGVINGGYVRGDRVYRAKSSLTVGDIRKEMPFRSTTVLVRIRGQDLKCALEQHLGAYPALSGSFPHVSGLTVQCTLAGGRCVIRSLVSSETQLPIDDQVEYLVATSLFNAQGGDGCTAWCAGEIVRHDNIIDDLVIAYLQQERSIGYSTSSDRLFIHDE